MEDMLKNCKIMIFLTLLVCSSSMRVKRRAGDQPPSGQCSTYKWGGTSGLHWYACCNNCETIDTSCDGKTYQTASYESYCGTCGIDTTKGNGKYYATYSCGGCQGQDRISTKCQRVGGLCTKFLDYVGHFRNVS